MMMTTIKLHINDSSCRQLYDAAAALFFVHSGETTEAYFGVLKVMVVSLRMADAWGWADLSKESL